jgi:hypothetical protein
MHEQVIVGEQVAGRAAAVRSKLVLMVNKLHVNEFDLADLLFEAQENNYPSGWGFASLPDYAEKELGLRPRKAQYLARITKVCRAVGLRREQYEPAKISKLREICTLDPEGTYWNASEHVSEPLDEHIVRLILDADKMNVEQTKDEVARLKGMSGPNRMVVRSCSVTQSAWDNVVQPAYELARSILGSQGRDDSGNAVEYKDGACLEVICAAFLADVNNQPDPGDTITLEQVLEENQAPPILPMETI